MDDDGRLFVSVSEHDACEAVKREIIRITDEKRVDKRGESVSFHDPKCEFGGDGSSVSITGSIHAATWRQGWMDLPFGGWTWISPRISVDGRIYTTVSVRASNGQIRLDASAHVESKQVITDFAAGFVNTLILEPAAQNAMRRFQDRIFGGDRIRPGLDRISNADLRDVLLQAADRLSVDRNSLQHHLSNANLNKLKDIVADSVSTTRRGGRVGLLSNPLNPVLAAFIKGMNDL